MDTLLDLDLDALVNTGEVECQGRHTHGVPACSVEVTHVLWYGCDPEQRPVCGNIARWVYAQLGEGYICDGCGRGIDTDWHIRPI